MPVVSVLMPVYNAADYLADAIESILCQTFRDFELILIDDGSTDGSLQIAGRFNDSRLKIVRNASNLGVATALNIGISKSRGPFLARMDADDISRPERLERQLLFMRWHETIGVCGSWVRCFDDKRFFTYRYPVGSECVRAYMLFANPLAHPSVMIDRQKFENHHLFYDPQYAAAQDYALWVRCRQRFALDNLPVALVDVRKNAQGVTHSRFSQSNAVSLALQKSLLLEMGLNVSDALLHFHRQVGNGSGMRSEKELRIARKWLLRIIHANAKCGIYNPHGMRQAVAMIWFRVCLNSAWMGPRIFRHYLQMPIQRAYRPGSEELVYFVASVLLRRQHGPTGRLPAGA